jgi:hypothetical protein
MKKIRIWQAATSTSVKYLCNKGAHRRKVKKKLSKEISKKKISQNQSKLLVLKTTKKVPFSVLLTKELSITAETKAGRRETLDLETSI